MIARRLLLYFFLLALTSRPLFSQAVVEGKVTLPKGSKPAPASPRYTSPNGIVADAPEGPAAVVYLEGNFPAKDTAPSTVEMKQKNLQFTPGLLPIRINTTVIFPNSDDLYHNVFSYSKAKRFDLGRYRKDEKPASQKFEKAGVVKLHCEIHEHMKGTILVLETPYFVKTNPDGTYRLENLPEGKFTLKAWFRENLVLEKPVELKSGSTQKVDFSE
jgi:plastocyanin